MVKLHRVLVNAVVILFCIQTNSHAKKSPKHQCPIGFKIAYSNEKEDPICYRLKGPESFSDSLKDCAGNLYTSKLYYNYNITKSDEVLWTEYRSLYPGGPFADWSYSDPTGDLLSTSFKVSHDKYSTIDEYSCIVIDPVSNFTAVSCEERNYRYCVVKPYSDKGNTEGCEKFKDSLRFSSPWPTCVVAVSAVGGGAVRATWSQAKELCEKRGGYLLNKGWRYSNNPFFATSGSYRMYPMNIEWLEEHNVLSHEPQGPTILEESDWNFADTDFSSDRTLGAVQDNLWVLVNKSYIFYDVLCERPIELKRVTLTVSVDTENKIILSVNQPVDKSEVFCFTESVYYPKSVKITYDETSGVYVLKPKDDGYYWCTHIDKKNFAVAESNMQLFIREKQSLANVYAVKIRLKDKYKLESIEKLWQNKLSEYIFYLTRFSKEHRVRFPDKALQNVTDIEKEIKTYKAEVPVDWKDKDIIRNRKVKRMYMDVNTALVHIEVNPDMRAVPPGSWDGVQVLFMRPVYYCPALDTVAATPLGLSVVTASCQNYSCIGDFNEGVQWITSGVEGCRPSSPQPVTGSISVYDDVTMIIPTIGTMVIPPWEIDRRDKEVSSEEKVELPAPVSPFTDRPFANSTDNVTTSFPTTINNLQTTEDSFSNSTESGEVEYTRWPWPPPRPPSTTDEPMVSTVVPIFSTTQPPPKPRPPPQEQLDQVMQDLESLLNNHTETVSLDSISGAFNQVDELLADTEDLEIPGQLLHLLDDIGARMDLAGSTDVAAVRENIALLVADARAQMPVKGLRISTRETDVFTENAFEIMRDPVNSTHLQSGDSEVVVQLPTSVATSERRISFVVFRTDRAFQNNVSHYTVNSRVLSINVENLTEFDQGDVIDIHLTPMRGDIERNQSRACAFWHFLEDGTGYWSQEGCTFIPSNEEGVLDTCRCDHLTHFAEILIPRTSFSDGHETALEIISIVGCIMSIIGLIMVGLTAILFRAWRRDFSNKIWLQLCIAVFILVTCFLIVVFANFEELSISCMLVGVLLHYSTLASFCWMLVAAIISYRRLVMVFTRDTSHKLLKASAFSWGAPCAVVGVLLSVAPRSYAGQFEGEVPSGAFCYPSGLALWLAVYAPIALMLAANWTLFALIVRSVFASRRIQRHGDTNEALRCASVSCLLVFLFGLPWIFGLFVSTNIVTVYLFTLTATFQGFVLFVFFVLGNKKTRELWLNKLKIRQTRKVPVTSSTYTNRSTGNPGWRGASAGPAAMEAKSAKPRSLASSDDSRFS
ncbi:hypothetical protein O3G_MSEX005616 [Manduca sexta]|uniref:Uncharacterized protein n=1 Tax=Manduca sexta TaxID=7130 RepID=A0A922CJ06_MANSE|nr:hypothetical protein O3G_MSEX005616 [Manduca sexta]KAG6448640.1 hypothetical protein O3G_MSEX005616 [Manduca sexta]KAG6448641.1 hypothetical protein O3G_MSEX005616 [Manduca sexta]